MVECCQTPTVKPTTPAQCPVCRQKGKGVALITLKALLQPTALERIHPDSSYLFCDNPSCDIVYFNDVHTFSKKALKVPVYQKEDKKDVPVCYCFGWTRERLNQALQNNLYPADHIRAQVAASRCGCEVNNPQGTCCLGNVNAFIKSLNNF